VRHSLVPALAPLLLACAPALAPAPAPAPAPASAPADWRRGLVYLALTDRFANGSPANDDLGQPGCHDPAAKDLFHGGDLAGLRAHLPYLRDLGVTALWATPLPAQVPLRNGACGYHGYWADEVDPDDGALEPKLGTWDDVAALTTDLHAAGMRFVLDMVVNHSGRGARIVRERPTWFHPDDASCTALGDPLVDCSLHGLPDYAQEDPVVASYLTALSRRWVARVRPDGIRMDTVKHVPVGYFARSFVPAVRAEVPGLFLLAEYFDDRGTAPLAAVLDAGFDSAFHFPLHRALVEAFARGGSVDGVADAVADGIAKLGADRAMRLVTFLDNHDVPRFLGEAPPGTSDDELARRYAVALVALFTLPGIPQIYQGDELAALGGYGDNRRDMPPWAWTDATRAGAHDGYAGDARVTFARVKYLAAVRAGDEALWKGAYTEIARASGAGNVLAFVRGGAGDAGRALVVLSGDASPRAVTLPVGPALGWPEGTRLTDAASLGAPAHVVVTRERVTLTMPAHAAAIYRAGS
jgi:glycosidase